GIVLQIGAGRHDDGPPGVLDARRERRRLAVVPREPDDSQPWLVRAQGDEATEAVVGAAVIDRDDLGRPTDRLERRAELGDQPVEALRLVIDRDDDRDVRRANAQNSVSATNWR